MTTLRDHIADVLPHGYLRNRQHAADALLADPTLAAIIDLAKWADDHMLVPTAGPEVRALLAAWRASRAEQEPTP